jgi:hypothetical protein
MPDSKDSTSTQAPARESKQTAKQRHDDLNTRRRRWLDKANRIRELGGMTFRVAYWIAYEGLDRGSERCIYSLKSIAAESGFAMITVKRAAVDLEHHGLVKREAVNGKPTGITLLFSQAQNEPGDQAQNEPGVAHDMAHDRAHDRAHDLAHDLAHDVAANPCGSKTTAPTPLDSVDSVHSVKKEPTAYSRGRACARTGRPRGSQQSRRKQASDGRGSKPACGGCGANQDRRRAGDTAVP